MKNYVCIFLLFITPVSVFSQKVNVQVISYGSAGLFEWRIIDQNDLMVYSGNSSRQNDTIRFSLQGNRQYYLQLSVSKILNTDTCLFSLRLNGEPVLLITGEIGKGIHSIPFFTGIRFEGVKITGGTDAVISDFPWQVYFESGNLFCGASIISENWVVIAAHCTENSDGSAIPASDMTIKVGATKPSDVSEGKNYSINQVIVHEEYNSQTLENDIALLKVKGTINFPNATPIKMVNADDVAEGAIIPGVMSWVTGWGLIRVNPNTLPSILQKVQLPIVSNSQASTVWSFIPSTDLMAGFLNGNKDACSGDSGGPLAVPVFGEYKLAGIVSWGSMTCNTYGAYTKVSDFETWIRTNTGIPKDFKPQTPVGDTIICQGVISDQYSIDPIFAASAYHWQIIPANAGVISGSSQNMSVQWNTDFIGSVDIILRATIDNKLSDWSRLRVNIIKNTKIISQSNDTTLCTGQQVILTVGAEGANLNFKWSKNGQLVQSGTSGQLNILKTSTDNSGTYQCAITGACNNVISKPIQLTVLPLTNISFISPDMEVPFGTDVTLEVDATGHDLIYEWQKDDTVIARSDTSRLFLRQVNATDIGLYQSTVTGTCGTEKSNLVYVFVRKDLNSAEPEIFVWPTVTSNEFNVALSNNETYTVLIINSVGKFLREQPDCQYQTIIDVSAMPKGVYIIIVFNNKIRKSFKLIKE